MKKTLLVCSYVERDNKYLYFIDPGKLDVKELKSNDIIAITSTTRGVSLAKIEHILDLDKQGEDFIISFIKDDFYSCYQDNYNRTRDYSMFKLKFKGDSGVEYETIRVTYPMNVALSFVKHDRTVEQIVLGDKILKLLNEKALLKDKLDDAILVEDPNLKDIKDEYRALLLQIKDKNAELDKVKQEIEDEKPKEVSEYEDFFEALKNSKNQ